MVYKRSTYATVLERIKEPRQFIQVIMGPRQVGKSTLVKQVLADVSVPWLFFSADDVPATRREWISDCWQQARLRMRAQRLSEMLLVIDEIQKLRNWSEVVKKEYDADTFADVNIKVILLGSSRVLLEKGLSESLFGRYEEIRMGHWTYEEMHEAFGFTQEQYVYFGSYPAVASLVRNEQRWRDYVSSAVVEATINKDILLDSPVSKPALLRQTFELASSYSGRILSLTKMLGSLQDAGNTTTLSSYLELLSQSGLVAGLQKYTVDAARRRASIPKYQVFNNALCVIYAGSTFRQAQVDHRLWGHLFESAVGAHLINGAFVNRYKLYYWREGNDEVDFILQKNQRLLAIEVKSNAETNNKGLTSFRERFHPDIALVVGLGGMPVEEFLTTDLEVFF